MNCRLSLSLLLMVLLPSASRAANDTQLDAQTQQRAVECVKEYCRLMQEFSADVEKIDNMETIYAMCENNNVSVINDLAPASARDISDNSMPLQQYMMMVTDKFENNVKTSYAGFQYLKAVVQPSPLEGFDAATYAFVKVDKQVNAPGINATHHLNIIVNTETMKVSSTTSEDFEDPQSIYLKALEKYNSNDFNAAIPLFEKVSGLQRFPGRYRAKSMLGWIFADQERYEQANNLLKEAAEEDPLGKVLLASKVLLSDQVPVLMRNTTEGIRILQALGEVRDKEIPQMHLIAKAALYDAQLDLKTLMPRLNLQKNAFGKLLNDLLSDPQTSALFQIRGHMGWAYLITETSNNDYDKAIGAVERAEALLKTVRLPRKAYEQLDAQMAILKIDAMLHTDFQKAMLMVVNMINDKPYAAPYLALRFMKGKDIYGPFLLNMYQVGAENGDPFSAYIVSISHYPTDPSGNFRGKYEEDWYLELLNLMDRTQLEGWIPFCIYLLTDQDQQRSAAEYRKWNQKAIDLGDVNAMEDRAYFEACDVVPFENVDITVALERACRAAVAGKRREVKLEYTYAYCRARENFEETKIPFEQTKTYRVLKSLDEQGNGAASYLLYFEYSTYQNNASQGVEYLTKSKDAGFFSGMYSYAALLLQTNYVDKALDMFNKLTVYPNSGAYFAMGAIEQDRNHYKEAMRYYLLGQKERDYRCSEGLSDLYKNGLGCEKNLKYAKWYIDDAMLKYQITHQDLYDEDNPTEELKEMMDKRSELERLLGTTASQAPANNASSAPSNHTSSASSNDDIIMPQFPNGTAGLHNFLNENLHYPEDAEKQGIHGKVIVSFIVDIDGTIKNVEVDQRVYPSLDAEAVRVINAMPKWKPATKQGTPVRVRYSVPISFSFTEEKTDSSMSPIERINQLIDPSKKENERIALSEELAEKLFASPNSIVKIVDSKGKKAVKENAKIALYAIAKNPTEAFHYVEISSKKDKDNKYIELTLQFQAK